MGAPGYSGHAFTHKSHSGVVLQRDAYSPFVNCKEISLKREEGADAGRFAAVTCCRAAASCLPPVRGWELQKGCGDWVGGRRAQSICRISLRAVWAAHRGPNCSITSIYLSHLPPGHSARMFLAQGTSLGRRHLLGLGQLPLGFVSCQYYEQHFLFATTVPLHRFLLTSF